MPDFALEKGARAGAPGFPGIEVQIFATCLPSLPAALLPLNKIEYMSNAMGACLCMRPLRLSDCSLQRQRRTSCRTTKMRTGKRSTRTGWCDRCSIRLVKRLEQPAMLRHVAGTGPRQAEVHGCKSAGYSSIPTTLWEYVQQAIANREGVILDIELDDLQMVRGRQNLLCRQRCASCL